MYQSSYFQSDIQMEKKLWFSVSLKKPPRFKQFWVSCFGNNLQICRTVSSLFLFYRVPLLWCFWHISDCQFPMTIISQTAVFLKMLKHLVPLISQQYVSLNQNPCSETSQGLTNVVFLMFKCSSQEYQPIWLYAQEDPGNENWNSQSICMGVVLSLHPGATTLFLTIKCTLRSDLVI